MSHSRVRQPAPARRSSQPSTATDESETTSESESEENDEDSDQEGQVSIETRILRTAEQALKENKVLKQRVQQGDEVQTLALMTRQLLEAETKVPYLMNLLPYAFKIMALRLTPDKYYQADATTKKLKEVEPGFLGNWIYDLQEYYGAWHDEEKSPNTYYHHMSEEESD